jgi:6,7-dimethyl-8-ribityllumazine synthase
MRILIVESRFYGEIADISLASASKVLDLKDIGYDVLSVHNIFEMPAAVNMKFEFSDYSGVIALGCAVPDGNLGYQAIYQECLRGLNDVGVYYAVPLGLGVFLAEDSDKAKVMAEEFSQNAALSCLQLIKIRDQFGFISGEHSIRYNN